MYVIGNLQNMKKKVIYKGSWEAVVRGLEVWVGRRRGKGTGWRGLTGAIRAIGQRRAPFSFTVAPHLDDCHKLQLHDPTRLRTRLFTPQGPFSQAVLDIFTSRFTSAENFNFTSGLCLHKDYVAGREFVAWKGGCCSGRGPPAAAASGSQGPGIWAAFGPGAAGEGL